VAGLGPAAAEPVADALRARLAAPAADGALYAPELLRVLYAGRDFVPLWMGGRAEEAQTALAAAEAHGLSTANYHRAAIVSGRGDTTPGGQAALDVLISDGLLLLGSHVRSGRIEPGSVTPRPRLLGVDADLPARLAAAPSAAAFLDGLVSPLAGYARLQDALRRYQALADAGGWSGLPPGPTLRPGDRDPAVAALRARLAREAADGPVGSNASTGSRPSPPARRRSMRRIIIMGAFASGAVMRVAGRASEKSTRTSARSPGANDSDDSATGAASRPPSAAIQCIGRPSSNASS
jgi:murein L,D-transpeptidase YcbB/YkuD